jgi:hypothetical protein
MSPSIRKIALTAFLLRADVSIKPFWFAFVAHRRASMQVAACKVNDCCLRILAGLGSPGSRNQELGF